MIATEWEDFFKLMGTPFEFDAGRPREWFTHMPIDWRMLAYARCDELWERRRGHSYEAFRSEWVWCWACGCEHADYVLREEKGEVLEAMLVTAHRKAWAWALA